MKHGSVAVMGIFLFVFIGCAGHQAIQYALDDIPSSSASALKKSTLSVETLADIRKETSDNAALFANDNDTHINDTHLCINAEKYYENGTVAHQISSMIVDHLKKKGVFKEVVLDKPASADYKLTGALKRFSGEQHFSTAARVGSQFGFLGALATAEVKTQGIIRIELSDLKLVDKQGAVVRKLDDIGEYFDGKMDADSDCLKIYRNTNDKLKNAIEQLARRLEKERL